MSGSKYYTDGIISYDNNLGTLYYSPTGGSGNVNLTPTPVYWMTTTNFSRTERTKSVWVQGSGNYSDLSFEVPITQEESPLMILLSDIGNSITHGTWQEPPDDTPTWRWQYTHTFHASDLGQIINIDVLTNGNVIDISSENIGGKYIIEAVQSNLEWVTTDFTLPMVHLSSAPDGEYEDYPSGVGTLGISTYKVNVVDWGKDLGKSFDTITQSNGIVSQITLGNGGAIVGKGLTTYGELQGLVAFRFQVQVNSIVPENDSVIRVRTAVYDSNGVNGVSSRCNLCRQLELTLTYSNDENQLEPQSGSESLQFSPAGTANQGGGTTHNPQVNVVSNIPWTITETEPEQPSL